MQDTKRIWAWVGGVIVVLGVVIFIFEKTSNKAPVASMNATSSTVVYAPQGQLTPQFPKDLLIGAVTSTLVNSSYAINYSSSTNQYTVVFSASSSMAVLYADYTHFFITNYWQITNKITKYPTSRGLYAQNASSDVAVAIIEKGKGSEVTITYVTK
jgi:hypothetical protein